jgi:hypothetical protein
MAVMKESSQTTKLRIVLDDSASGNIGIPFHDTSWAEVFHDTSWAQKHNRKFLKRREPQRSKLKEFQNRI